MTNNITIADPFGIDAPVLFRPLLSSPELAADIVMAMSDISSCKGVGSFLVGLVVVQKV